MAGCDVAAKYNSADVHIVPAMKAGYKLDVVSNAVVREVAVSNENRVTGVRYVNRETKAEGEVLGRSVVVSCACAQSVALLLMSKSRIYPNGLANSSGELGRNFIPHFTGGIQFCLTDMIGKPTTNDEGFLDHAYIPSFMHDRPRDYPRSFGFQFNYQNRRAVGWARSMKGMGASFKESVKRHYPAYITVTGYMEMTPNRDSYIDLDEKAKDRYGLPGARRHWKLSDDDWKRFHAVQDWGSQILRASKSQILSVAEMPTTNHEIGGCRMGSDPKRSILNQYCQAHDVPNLYVVDASAFPSASEKNPTHTIMAMASRAADNIADRLKKGEV